MSVISIKKEELETEGLYFKLPTEVNFDRMLNLFLNRPSGLDWPWQELSKLTKIDIGSITTMIAGTSHGKTAVAISLALDFLRQGKKVLFWSGEMPPEILTMRMLGILAGVSMPKLNRELQNYRAGMPVMPDIYHALPIIRDFCERLYLPPAWEYRECEQLLVLAEDIIPDVIIVDYIQQLRIGRAKYRSRDEEIEAVMDELNLHAISKNIPIVNFAQINREAKNTETPNLTCIRHSATIEQYSANVIGIWNASMARHKGSTSIPSAPADGWYWQDNADATNQAAAFAEAEEKTLMELAILKSRYHGNVGKAVPLLFSGDTGGIEDFPESAATVRVVEF